MKSLFFSSIFFVILSHAIGQNQRLVAVPNDSLKKGSEKDTMVDVSDLHLKPDSGCSAVLITASFAYQFPGADLAKRFGSNGSIGGGAYYKTQSNWLFGAEAHFIFGGKPKDKTILDSLRTGKTSDGSLIDQNGHLADARMFERGYDITARIGKIFPFGTLNRNSGVFVMAGGGFVQHKIRIENLGNHVPQVSKEYRVGYDHLTNGMLVSESVGFFYMSDEKLLNFSGALEFAQGFTQGRRYDFNTMKIDNAKRTDLFFGVRIAWMLPIRPRKPEEFYYF